MYNVAETIAVNPTDSAKTFGIAADVALAR